MPNYVVTTNADVVDENDGLTSLREAIVLANGQAGADTITFDPSVFTGGPNSLIRLVQGQLEITDALTIDASAIDGVTITGDANGDDELVAGTDITDVAASLDGQDLLADNSRLFLVSSPRVAVTLDSLTLTGGRTTGDSEFGGAIFAGSQEVTFLNSTVSGNSTAGVGAGGGGIGVGFLTLTNSTVTGNATSGDDAFGGGVAAGIATVTNSTITGNSTEGAGADGGGLGTDFATLTDSTITGNATAGDFSRGGGIFARQNATLTNSTVSENVTGGSSASGGGLFAVVATVTNSTITGNATTRNSATGGGINANSLTVTNSTITGNATGGAGAHGGGLVGNDTTVTNSTITGNATTGVGAEGGGFFVTGIRLTNSLVIGNVSEQTANDETRFTNTQTSQGGNIIGDILTVDGVITQTGITAAEVFAATQDNNGVEAGVLADNGGPVQTVALLASVTNPAIDASASASATSADARGIAASDRPGVGADDGAGIRDLGAFELPGNFPPVAVEDTYSTQFETELTVDAALGVLSNDSDPEQDTLTAALIDTPANGALTLNQDGSFTYRPDAEFFGTDSFVYVANDGSADSVFAEVTITVGLPPTNFILDTADTVVRDDLLATARPDVFIMTDDGTRDLIRNFDVGLDRIDVSSFAASIDDLNIQEQTRSNGSVNWISVVDRTGETEIAVRFNGDTPLLASALNVDSFIFATQPLPDSRVIVPDDSAEHDDLSGAPGPELFVMSDDGFRDLIRNFDASADLIDVSSFAASFDDLTIQEQRRGDGNVNWINVVDRTGETEFALRFDGDTPLLASNLQAANFVFSSQPLPDPTPNTLTDSPGYDDFAGTNLPDVFVMSDDGVRDLIRNFDVGTDLLDVRAFATDFSELTIEAQTRPNGSLNWISVLDSTGDIEMAIRFEPGVALDVGALTEDSFLFG